jgi:hypothetical protein
MRDSNATDNTTRPLPARRFVVGRDSRGRWTVRGAEGSVGGFFKNKDAALRYARSEAGGLPGAVRLTLSPQELTFSHGRLGKGEGLPAWWRLGPATAGPRSFTRSSPIIGNLDRRWLAVDATLIAGLAVLCLTVGAALS